jgi:hypothetical protein
LAIRVRLGQFLPVLQIPTERGRHSDLKPAASAGANPEDGYAQFAYRAERGYSVENILPVFGQRF